LSIEQILKNEILESQWALDGPIDDTIYRRDHSKRIGLINWVLKNMKNSDIFICETMETKINEIIDKINKTHNIFEADPLDSELRIPDWILYQVCSNEIKKYNLSHIS
jgi:hypothetical protein